MSGILGANGKPISSKNNFAAGQDSPVIGESFGAWAGKDLQFLNMPGGGVVQFDLSRLGLSDFRQMSTHYQVNSSLSVLMFMLHQLDWHIECEDKRVEEHVTENLSNIWTRLVRAMSQAFWAGYSPSILQWENNSQGQTVQLTKIKDLTPEEASVNWKEVEGANVPGSNNRQPKVKVYDGIKKIGSPDSVPVANSFWYPLLMENGNYGGRKLLKPAFQPWFFSTLIHLFSNRYFERFGEPVPVGRAPLDDTVRTKDGKDLSATDYMGNILQSVRSRAAVVLPSDRAMDSTGSATNNFDYTIEYLESQMRGADFERYMTRLDEEISLSLFTPLLLMRTADVGSYNLGVSHMQMYLWQLNAIAADWKEYIDKYIIAPMARYNFGPNAKLPKIVFHKMGKSQAETNRTIVQSLVGAGKVDVDLVQLGQDIGIELTKVEELKAPDDSASVYKPAKDAKAASAVNLDTFASTSESSVVDGASDAGLASKIIERVAPQAARAHAKGAMLSGWMPDIGFTSHLSDMQSEMIKVWQADIMDMETFDSSENYMKEFTDFIESILVE